MFGTIRLKLITAIIFLLLLLSGTAGVGLFYVYELDDNIKRLSEDITPTIESTDDMIASLWERGKIANEIMASEDISEITELFTFIAPLNGVYTSSYEELEKLLDPSEKEIANEAVAANKELQIDTKKMYQSHYLELEFELKAKQLLNEFDGLGGVLITSLDEFAIENEAEMAKAEDRGDILAESGTATASDVNDVLGELFERDYPVVEAALKLQRYIIEMQDTAGEYLAEEEPSNLPVIRENFDVLAEKVESHMTILFALAESEEDKQDAKDLKYNFVQWQALALNDEKLFDTYREQLRYEAEADDYTNHLEISISKADALLEQLTAAADTLADLANDEAEVALKTAVTTVGVVWLTALVFGFVTIIALIKAIIIPVDNLVNRLKDIAEGEGDLTQRVDEDGKDELAALGVEFNLFVVKIQSLISQISTESNGLDNSIVSISDISEKVCERVNMQSKEVQQVVSYIAQVNDAAESISSNAQNCSGASKDANNDSEAVRTTVQQAISSIGELAGHIDDSSNVINELNKEVDNIASVLDVIQAIAEQTNLLALNAAIEAARAGEQGRGFAVVADEVRTLASRTQNCTNEIQTMIQNLQKGASAAVTSMSRSKEGGEETVTIANQAGVALDRVSMAITNLNQLNEQIATAAEEQRSIVNSATKSVSHVKTVVEESLNASIENQENTVHMSKSVDRLNGLVKQFKV